MSDKTTTERMRAIAEAKYAEMGERHPYTGTVRGLATILVEEGVPADLLDAYASIYEEEKLAPDPLRRLARGLSNILHDPLCTIDPCAQSFALITYAIDATLLRDYKRDETDFWRESYGGYTPPPVLADFDGFAGQVIQVFKDQKIRRGTKRAREFYADPARRARILEQIRVFVAEGIERVRAEGKKRGAEVRKEDLAPIEKRIARLDAISAIRKGMMAALLAGEGLDPSDKIQANVLAIAPRVDALIAKHRARWVARQETVERTARYEETRADGYDVARVMREEMGRKPELAPFLEEPAQTPIALDEGSK